MNEILMLVGIVIMLCILLQKVTTKLPIPSLLMFLLLGMMFGVNGIFKISFDNYQLSETVCSVCLLFIMFYGGFGTSIQAAKPVLIRSGLLASIGVLLTAMLTGAFVHFVLGVSWLEGLLIGSVIASTDAASVFGILRREKLNLKDNTASLLEVESGSNDPVSYMLTVVLCALMNGQDIAVGTLLIKQILLGVSFGLAFGYISTKAMKKGLISNDGKVIFVFAVAVITYALTSIVGGNGYLAVYLCGIVLGNANVPSKHNLVNFFDTMTSMAQMMIFFLLGLLVTPAHLGEVFLPALMIMVFLTLIGRPVAVSLTLLPFGTTKEQIGLVSFAGLRGVASIVFAITVVLSKVELTYNIFNLVFCIVLISISFQGTLLPYVSKKLQMIDDNVDVLKTFTDYEEENDIRFIKTYLEENHPWINQTLSQIVLPSSLLIVMIIRNKQQIVPKGDTVLLEGDLLVYGANEYNDKENLNIKEIVIEKNHSWENKTIKELPLNNELIVMIQRHHQTIIPDGNTPILRDDLLVIVHNETIQN